jgi:schlafen family protein
MLGAPTPWRSACPSAPPPASATSQALDIESAITKVRAGQPANELESFTLDFKTEKTGFKDTATDLAEACVCFANAVGGRIVVGIKDRVDTVSVGNPSADRSSCRNITFNHPNIWQVRPCPIQSCRSNLARDEDTANRDEAKDLAARWQLAA